MAVVNQRHPDRTGERPPLLHSRSPPACWRRPAPPAALAGGDNGEGRGGSPSSFLPRSSSLAFHCTTHRLHAHPPPRRPAPPLPPPTQSGRRPPSALGRGTTACCSSCACPARRPRATRATCCATRWPSPARCWSAAPGSTLQVGGWVGGQWAVGLGVVGRCAAAGWGSWWVLERGAALLQAGGGCRPLCAGRVAARAVWASKLVGTSPTSRQRLRRLPPAEGELGSGAAEGPPLPSGAAAAGPGMGASANAADKALSLSHDGGSEADEDDEEGYSDETDADDEVRAVPAVLPAALPAELAALR